MTVPSKEEKYIGQIWTIADVAMNLRITVKKKMTQKIMNTFYPILYK
jgi:hypothetical protein